MIGANPDADPASSFAAGSDGSASSAVEHRLTVLHDDRDFDRIRRHYGDRPDAERLRLPSS
jgi:hypothetical protein